MVHATSSSALERLADELGSADFATILTGGHTPTLRVINRRSPERAEDIRTGDGWFCGLAIGRMAPCGNISAAAQAVARVVGGRGQ